MRVLLWIGNESNQRALANKIGNVAEIVGIVTETRKVKRKLTAGFLLRKIIEKVFLAPVSKAWQDMKGYYNDRYPDYPQAPLLDCSNINSLEVFEFSSELQPDLIVVSGTSLIRESLLSISPRLGIMNLHTGVSPYIKGGPNCTNWCLATGQFHLIGNTVMWIDAGIDTGKVITTELTPLNGKESLRDIHIKVMEHAHDLYLRSIARVKEENVPGVSQAEIAGGVTYYTRNWGLQAQWNLMRNFRRFESALQSSDYLKAKSSVRLVGLDAN